MDKDKSIVLVRKSSPRVNRKLWKISAIGILVIAGAWGISKGGVGQQAIPDTTQQERILPVATQPLQLSKGYDVERTYSGEVQARRVSEVGFEMTGTLIDLPLREGDRVQKGAVLARLDTRQLNAQRKQLLAQRAQAEAQLSELQTGPRLEEIAAAKATVQDLQQQVLLAQRLSDRRKALYEKGAVSRESYEERFFNAQSLKKRQEQAQKRLDELEAGTRVERVDSQDARILEIDAQLEMLDVQRSKTVLKAPFSGVISQKLVSEGVVLNSGQAIVRLVESGPMEAHIGIPQDVSQGLNVGQRMPIRVGGQQYQGKVSAFLPEVDPSSRTVTVVFDFIPQSTVTIGQTAELVLTQSEGESGYWVPLTAVVAGDRGLWSAYVLKPAEEQQRESVYEVAKRDVEVIHTEGDRVYVRGMLQPGESIIMQGTHRLANGQLVTRDSRAAQ